MGKEKKKKNNKKYKVNYVTDEEKEIRRFVIVLLVVIVAVGGIYLLTRAFVTKDLFTKKGNDTKEVTEGKVNYDVAMIGDMLNRPYKKYYVVIYDTTNDDYSSDMYSLVYNYGLLKKDKHLYTVDLSNSLNKSYYDAKKVNTKATTLKDLKVGDITLLEVTDGKISKYIVDYAKMQTELGITK